MRILGVLALLAMTFVAHLATAAPQAAASPKGFLGTFETPADEYPKVKFEVSKSPIVGQYQIKGQMEAPDRPGTAQIRGTFFEATNRFRAFVERQDSEVDSILSVTLDGTFTGAGFTLTSKITRISDGKIVDRRVFHPVAVNPPDQYVGRLAGTFQASKARAKAGEPVTLTLVYSLEDADSDDVSVEVNVFEVSRPVSLAKVTTKATAFGGKPQRCEYKLVCPSSGTYSRDASVLGTKSRSLMKGVRLEIEASNAASDFSGEWDSDAGRMTILQSGNSVSGKYKWMDGTFKGTVTGSVMEIVWEQPKNERYGVATMKMAAGNRSFSGEFEYTKPADAKGKKGRWNGTRVGEPPAGSASNPNGQQGNVTLVLVGTTQDASTLVGELSQLAVEVREGADPVLVKLMISGYDPQSGEAVGVEPVVPAGLGYRGGTPEDVKTESGGAGMVLPLYFYATSQTPLGAHNVVIKITQKGRGDRMVSLVVRVSKRG